MTIGIACAFSVAVAHLGTLVANDARAHIAAESAALAGALEGERQASAAADLNGASLTEFAKSNNRITVVVEIKGMRATASADIIGIPTIDTWPSPTTSNP